MTLLEETGKWLIVGFFLVSGLANLTKARIADHIQRMRVFGTPFPVAVFGIGIALQFTGCALLIAGWHPAAGVGCLIVFANVAILGGLLLLLADVL